MKRAMPAGWRGKFQGKNEKKDAKEGMEEEEFRVIRKYRRKKVMKQIRQKM